MVYMNKQYRAWLKRVRDYTKLSNHKNIRVAYEAGLDIVDIIALDMKLAK